MTVENLTNTSRHTLSQIDWAHNIKFLMNYAMKRAMDVTISAILLILLAPLMVILTFIVKSSSDGPAVFKQERVGAKMAFRNGRLTWEPTTFTFYKFRSMYQNSDSARHKAFFQAFVNNDADTMKSLQGDDEIKNGESFKMTNDPRVTPIGATLRKTSLDELPQLMNIMQGHMSLVGPRPCIPYEVEMYKDWYRERLNAKPGLTGLWQVEGRSAVTFEDTMKMDIQYVRTQNIVLDMKIFLMTPIAVIKSKGAR